MTEKDELFAKLDADGEQVVRENLAQKVYGHKKIPLVEEWLRREEEERSRKSEEAKNKIALDMLDATKRQASAAETAASSALEQARIARTAKNIAIIAMIIGIAVAIVNIAVALLVKK